MSNSALNESAVSNISLGQSDLEESASEETTVEESALGLRIYKDIAAVLSLLSLAQAPEGTKHQVRSKEETSFSQSQMLHCWIARKI
jgi:hypothetical protein